MIKENGNADDADETDGRGSNPLESVSFRVIRVPFYKIKESSFFKPASSYRDKMGQKYYPFGKPN